VKITRIETVLVGHGWNNVLITRLHTASGLTGIGAGTMQWQAKTVPSFTARPAVARYTTSDPTSSAP
jgi:hypothetical protein